MAHPTPTGLAPSEVAFLCEMELVTVIPREQMGSLQLLGGKTPNLRPPHRANLPLWLALLLKRQKRADIAPPPWLHTHALQAILDAETSGASGGGFTDSPALPEPKQLSGSSQPAQLTPPFQLSNTSDAGAGHLPYHWLEMSEMLLSAARDDIADSENVRRLLRDLREVRAAKVRASLGVLDGSAGVRMNGVGAMEIAESRAFITGVVDGLRKVGAAREAQGREEAEERARDGGVGDDDEDEDML